MLLEFIESNKIILCATPVITEEDQIIRYVKCAFHFTSELWLNMVTIRAVFKSASYGDSEEVILDSSNCCYMPIDVYKHGGVIQVALYGDYLANNGTRAVTSYIGPVNVFFGKNPRLPVPIPSRYDVFVAEYFRILSENSAVLDEMQQLIEDFSDISDIRFTEDLHLVITMRNGDVYVSPVSLKGDKGDRGNPGASGPPGEPGPSGVDGKSAYESAVDGGYSGTEDEFEAKLAADIPEKTSDLINDSGFLTEAPVSSVNNKTGAVALTASDVGALPNDTAIPSKTSDLTNDSGFITSYTETDPTVPSWAKASSKPTYTASEVGALPSSTVIPSKTSELTNDSGFISSETDPTVPSWAKASSKPSYTASEVGALPDSTVIPPKGALFYGKVDSTSTATVFTAQIDGITEYFDGLTVILKNGVVTSAANFTININGLGALPVYSNMAASTRETTIFNVNYTLMLVYEHRVSGGNWLNYRGYYSDANSIGYQLRTASMSLPMTSIVYRYRLLFTAADHAHFVPANSSSSTNATSSRTVCQNPIDPFGEIRYYGTTASVAAGSRPAVGNLWEQYGITLGYSFNRTGAALVLAHWKPVYIKCAPQSDGSAIIDADTPYVQTLPSTEDGKIYIYLGVAYSDTQVELVPHHPVYWYKGGMIRLYTNAIASGGGGVTDVTLDGTSVVSAGVAALTSPKLTYNHDSSPSEVGTIEGFEVTYDGKQFVVNTRIGGSSNSLYVLTESGTASDYYNKTQIDDLFTPTFCACDATTRTVLSNGFSILSTVVAPSDITSMSMLVSYLQPGMWFAWMNGAELEFARLSLSVNTSTSAGTLYLRGRTSIATGIFGVDSSWTVSALASDAEGVAY